MDIKNLREEYASLHAANSKLLSETNGKLSPEDKETSEKRYARMDEIKAQVENVERAAKYALEVGNVERVEPKGKNVVEAKREFTAADYRKAINEFLRTGDVNAANRFATITTTGSSAFLPTQVLPPVSVLTAANVYKAAKAKYGSPIITLGSTSGLKLPVWDDSANAGGTLTQGATSETTPVDASPAAIDLTCVVKESVGSWFSNSVLEANGFDLLAYAAPQIQVRLERDKHSDIDTAVKAATTGMTTVASTSAITYAEWLTFEHSLPVAYRYNMALVLSDTAFKLLRSVVDSQGNPIMDTDPQNVFQQNVHGIPIFIS